MSKEWRDIVWYEDPLFHIPRISWKRTQPMDLCWTDQIVFKPRSVGYSGAVNPTGLMTQDMYLQQKRIEAMLKFNDYGKE